MFIDAATGSIALDGAHIFNGQAYGGNVAENIVRFEPGLMRPYLHNGRACVTINSGRRVYNEKTGRTEPLMVNVALDQLRQYNVPIPQWVSNATAIQKEAWIEFDNAIVRATRLRLKAWADLAARNPRGGFDAMSKLTLEYQAMTDPGFAKVDMEGLSQAPNDRPLFQLRSVPLPITHSDFFFPLRELMVSRTTSTPFDTTMAEAAGRRIAETVEQTLIGTITGIRYGDVSAGPGAHDTTNSNASKVYGYTNFPFRVTKTDLHTPATATPENVIEDILEMRETMQTNGFFGPYMLYHSTGYDRFLDDDYFRTGGTAVTRTLRERILAIPDISGLSRLDYLTSGYQLIMIQMDPEVAQAIVGMQPTVMQWESRGGLLQCFKVMAIMVPLLKAPYNGVGGILHATTS